MSAVAMPVMVMVMMAPTVMARAPSMMTMTAPAVPSVPAPAVAVMSAPTVVSAIMVVMVPAPTVLDRNDAGLCRFDQGCGWGKRGRLNDPRCDTTDSESEGRSSEPTSRPICECAKRHVSLRRMRRRGNPGAVI